MTRCVRVVLAAAFVALLAACHGSPSPALYTLAARPGLVIGRPVPSVAVRSVEIAKYLDRPQIVRRKNEYELETSDFERWDEDFDDMVTRVLVENLSQRLPASQVTMRASPVTTEAQMTLAVDIERFDADPGGRVILVAQWTLQRGARSGTVRLERIAVPAASDAAIDLAAAMSDCLGQLSDRLAQAIAASAG